MARTNQDSNDSRQSPLPQQDSAKILICPKLKEFYDRHNVGVQHLVSRNDDASSQPSMMRFVRFNPRHDKAETLRLLKHEVASDEQGDGAVLPVPWLDEQFGFYAISGSFALAKSESFKSGRVYGMDVSSGAAVSALLSGHHDKTAKVRVLDLCCCPGLKLCMIADVLASSSSTVVGVDVSEQRMAVCKRIVRKYQVNQETSGATEVGPRIRLYCTDGTKFGTTIDPELVFDSIVAKEDQKMAGKRKRMNKSAQARERKRLQQLASVDKVTSTASPIDDNGNHAQPATVEPFDFVLVDAECSTDGSLKHVQQRISKNVAQDAREDDAIIASNPTLTDRKQLESLVELQKRLIESGFKLLKPGGVLVYSTCSLSADQNERVVQWLLDCMEAAFIVPVTFPLADHNLVLNGSIDGTLRFLPGPVATKSVGGHQDVSFFGGGFFLAKISKRNVSTDT